MEYIAIVNLALVRLDVKSCGKKAVRKMTYDIEETCNCGTR